MKELPPHPNRHTPLNPERVVWFASGPWNGQVRVIPRSWAIVLLSTEEGGDEGRYAVLGDLAVWEGVTCER